MTISWKTSPTIFHRMDPELSWWFLLSGLNTRTVQSVLGDWGIETRHKLNNFYFSHGNWYLMSTTISPNLLTTGKLFKLEWIDLSKECHNKGRPVRKFRREKGVNWQYNILAGNPWPLLPSGPQLITGQCEGREGGVWFTIILNYL